MYHCESDYFTLCLVHIFVFLFVDGTVSNAIYYKTFWMVAV